MCNHENEKDLANGMGQKHLYCPKCGGHEYDGKRYARTEWEAYVNDGPNDWWNKTLTS